VELGQHRLMVGIAAALRDDHGHWRDEQDSERGEGRSFHAAF
jgi:hypothetical protein